METNPTEWKNAQAELEQLYKQPEATTIELSAFEKKIEKVQDELRAQFQARLDAAKRNAIQSVK